MGREVILMNDDERRISGFPAAFENRRVIDTRIPWLKFVVEGQEIDSYSVCAKL